MYTCSLGAGDYVCTAHLERVLHLITPSSVIVKHGVTVARFRYGSLWTSVLVLGLLFCKLGGADLNEHRASPTQFRYPDEMTKIY